MHQPAAPARTRKPRRRRRWPWSTLPAAGIVLAAIAALTAAALVGMPGPVLLGIGGAGCALIGWVFRRPAAALVGPLFAYDLLRLARRGRSTLLRCAYALLLLGGLYAVYEKHFPSEPLLTRPFAVGASVPLAELAHFAGTFAVAILALQGVAVVVLTPAYLAGAIAEERERRTLELLFTTHLGDREIVLGKLCSRLTHLAGVLLAGLPVLSLLQLWGGVNLAVLVAGFAVTALTLLSVGSVSILCSVLCRTSLGAVLSSYAIVLVVFGVCLPCFLSSPLAFLFSIERHLGVTLLHDAFLGPGTDWGASSATFVGVTGLQLGAMLFAYALVHGLIAVLCLSAAVENLRGQSSVEPVRPRPVGRPEVERPGVARQPARVIEVEGWDPEPLPAWLQHRPPSRRRYPVSDPPLLWKEVYHGADPTVSEPFWAVYGSVLGIGFLLAVLGVSLGQASIGRPGQPTWHEVYALVRDGVNPALRVLGILLTAAWCLGVAWRTAGCITREREGRTLGGLLMLPTDREAILGAKWLAGPLRYRHVAYALPAVWTLGLVTGALHPVAVLLLALATAVHVAFLASFGVWLSLNSRNTMWAYLGMGLMLLVMFVGPWVALLYGELLGSSGTGGETWWDDFAQVGLNPPRTWWYFGYTWDDFRTDVLDLNGGLQGPLGATLAGLGIYAVAAGALWLAACRRFRTEQPGGA